LFLKSTQDMYVYSVGKMWYFLKLKLVVRTITTGINKVKTYFNVTRALFVLRMNDLE